MLNHIFQSIPFHYFIIAIVLAPLLSSLLCSIIQNDKLSSIVSIIGSSISLLSACFIAFGLLGLEDTRPAVITGDILNWATYKEFVFSIGFRIDELSLWFVVVIAFLGLASVVLAPAIGFTKINLLNLLIGSVQLIFISDNLLLVLAGWILSGAALYAMSGKSSALLESTLFIILGIALAAISMVAGENPPLHVFSWETWENNAIKIAPLVLPIASSIMLGAIFRMGLFPFSKWTETKSNDPIVLTSAIAIISASAAYIILRCHFMLVLTSPVLGIFKWWALIALIVSIILALKTTSFEKTFSLINSINAALFLLTIGFGGFIPAAIYIILSTLLKGGMTLVSGPALVDKNGGLIKRFPVSGWCFVINAFLLAGVIPGSVYFALEYMLSVIQNVSIIWWIVALICSGLFSFILLRTAGALFLGRRQEFPNFFQELPPAILIILVLVPTIGFIVTILHPSPFIGTSLAYKFFSGVLPLAHFNEDSRKLAGALLMFITAQPAIIAAAVYAQRIWKTSKPSRRTIPAYIKETIPLPSNKPAQLIIEEILVNGTKRIFFLILSFVDWVGTIVSGKPILAISVAFIIILIGGFVWNI